MSFSTVRWGSKNLKFLLFVFSQVAYFNWQVVLDECVLKETQVRLELNAGLN